MNDGHVVLIRTIIHPWKEWLNQVFMEICFGKRYSVCGLNSLSIAVTQIISILFHRRSLFMKLWDYVKPQIVNELEESLLISISHECYMWKLERNQKREQIIKATNCYYKVIIDTRTYVRSYNAIKEEISNHIKMGCRQRNLTRNRKGSFSKPM